MSLTQVAPFKFVQGTKVEVKEAAIHAMSSVSDADETDAVLLIDASNAFNALNRAVLLSSLQTVRN